MNILSTDMKKHFDFLKIFEMKLAKLQESGEPISNFIFGCKFINNYTVQKDEDRKLFSGMIVHTCDFAHKTKPFSQDKEWSMRICKEFNSQVFFNNLLLLQYININLGGGRIIIIFADNTVSLKSNKYE